MNAMESIAPMIGMLFFCYFTFAIIRIILDHRFRTRLLLTQSDMHGKLLDRIGAGPDALEYLKSGAGVQLLDAAAFERGTPHARILGSLQAGIVIALAGLAFLLLKGTFPEADARAGMAFVGGLGLAVGVGFVISAAVAHRLSRAWGLLNGRGPLDTARE